MQCELSEKICLNHALTDHIKYERKGNKSWIFKAKDMSDDLTTFCLRFETEKFAEKFKRVIDGFSKIRGRSCDENLASKFTNPAATCTKEILKTKAQQKLYYST